MCCDHLVEVLTGDPDNLQCVGGKSCHSEDSLELAYFFMMFAYLLLHSVWSALKSLPLGSMAPLAVKCCTRISTAAFPDLWYPSLMLLHPQTTLDAKRDCLPPCTGGRMCTQPCVASGFHWDDCRERGHTTLLTPDLMSFWAFDALGYKTLSCGKAVSVFSVLA